MKKILIIVLALLTAAPAFGQRRYDRRGPRTDGFYFMLGSTSGPNFSDFYNYMDDTYGDPGRFKEFGSNISLNIGYLNRIRRNFAVDVGFSVYSLNSKGTVTDNFAIVNPQPRIAHELDYQCAIFTGTMPIIFEFQPRQSIVPYVGVGISIFAMRLDDYRDYTQGTSTVSEAQRDTRTSVGGHFEAGICYKITSRIWLDLRGRWHGGGGHIATLENDWKDFSIKQNISQYSIGVDYFFH
jgi:opacity protein-like surface antigen